MHNRTNGSCHWSCCHRQMTPAVTASASRSTSVSVVLRAFTGRASSGCACFQSGQPNRAATRVRVSYTPYPSGTPTSAQAITIFPVDCFADVCAVLISGLQGRFFGPDTVRAWFVEPGINRLDQQVGHEADDQQPHHGQQRRLV